MFLSKKLPHRPPFPCFFRRLLLPGAHLSTAAAAASRNPSTASSPSPAPVRAPAAAEPHFLIRYLVESCGFSKTKAAEVSKPVLARIKSAESAAAVISFLREQGFTKDGIRRVVSAEPWVLCASVGEALEPKFRALKDAGFSRSDIPTLFSTKPEAFRVSDLAAKVGFWATLFHSKDKLLKAILKSRYILLSSLDEKMKPNVSLLFECVQSKPRVAKMVSKRPLLLTANTETLRKVIKRVESFGIPRDSGLFDKALYVLFENSVETLNDKFEALRSFGWSECEFLSAMQKNPTFLGSSKRKIQSIMEFLLRDVGCEPSYVVARPNLLTYSLEGRMMPRHRVLHMLALSGLVDEGYDFHSVVKMTENGFLKRYVLRHGEKAPELYQSYVATCTSKDPS